jgi:hypothetical protein
MQTVPERSLSFFHNPLHHHLINTLYKFIHVYIVFKSFIGYNVTEG